MAHDEFFRDPLKALEIERQRKIAQQEQTIKNAQLEEELLRVELKAPGGIEGLVEEGRAIFAIDMESVDPTTRQSTKESMLFISPKGTQKGDGYVWSAGNYHLYSSDGTYKGSATTCTFTPEEAKSLMERAKAKAASIR